MTLSANAADDVQVAGVEFKVNGTVIGADSTAPYQFSYRVPINISSFSVTATAYDLSGNTGTTDPITVSVTPDPPPTVEITAPGEGTTLIEGQVVEISATAADNQSIAQVKFFANGIEAAVDPTSPYSVSFTVPTGISTLADGDGDRQDRSHRFGDQKSDGHPGSGHDRHRSCRGRILPTGRKCSHHDHRPKRGGRQLFYPERADLAGIYQGARHGARQ